MSAEPQPKPQAFFLIGELQARWRVSRATIYAEVARGRLRRTHIAGAVRFSSSEVERYERTATN